MNNLNIFDSAKPQTGEFFKFKNIGDGIQGTYIDNRDGVDSFGNDQIIYVVMDNTGKIWNLGFRKTSLVIHERMKNIRFGQIVGFRFDEERDSKKNVGTKVKIIRIYADPKLVDHEWLQQQKELEAKYGPINRPAPSMATAKTNTPAVEYETFPETTVPAGATPPVQNLPQAAANAKNEAIEAIRNLARTKGLVAPGIADNLADKVIEEYTGKKLTEENLTKIIIALTGFTAK